MRLPPSLHPLRITSLLLGCLSGHTHAAPAAEAGTLSVAPPFEWSAPASFDPTIPGLGLRQLPGVSHHTLYAPHPSQASLEDGGDGVYESLQHGTYNHHTQAVVLGDKVVVYWTNHCRDENGPGQRLLARWGTISADRETIDWGTPETNLVELVPPPAPVRRREPLEAVKDRRYVEGHLHVIDGKLRSSGKVAIYHGWTDDLKFRTPHAPVPEERFRELRDNARGYQYDMRWDVGPHYAQLWQFDDGRLKPASPLYLDRAPLDKITLTPTQSLTLGTLLEPYRSAPTLEEASPEVRHLLTQRAVSRFSKSRATYAPGTRHLAANGKHGLAHMAQFQRPDGMCVIIRDNLVDPDFYFAAEAPPGGAFPPAVATNLFGYAMPAAGELPDGTCWILSNSKFRYDFFLTTAKDGKAFNKTWAIAHDATRWQKGLFKPASSGPQYPFPLQIGNAIWVFYSVGKEQIAASRIPFTSLYQEEQVLASAGFPEWQATAPEQVNASAKELLFLPGKGAAAASFPFPSQQLDGEGARLTAHLQLSLREPKNEPAGVAPLAVSFRSSSAPNESPVAIRLIPTEASPEKGPDSRATLRHDLSTGLKYDFTFSIERRGAGFQIHARLFGGDLKAPVETTATLPIAGAHAFDTLEVAFPSGLSQPLCFSHTEVIHAAPTPRLIPSTREQEKKTAHETAGIHALMADH